jgi:hypothetical protein
MPLFVNQLIIVRRFPQGGTCHTAELAKKQDCHKLKTTNLASRKDAKSQRKANHTGW